MHSAGCPCACRGTSVGSWARLPRLRSPTAAAGGRSAWRRVGAYLRHTAGGAPWQSSCSACS
eukprot:2165856-Lingulodinium_polyedra.AAC.1